VSAAAGEADPIVELCAFAVGDEEYAIDVRRVREIVQPLPVMPVPHAAEWMEGLVNLRGEVVPLVDLRARLGLPRRPPTTRSKLLVTKVAGRVVALAVDGVSEVLRVPRSEIGPPPGATGGPGRNLFLGVCGARARAEGARGAPATRVRLLLNVKALLEPAAGCGR
jgi:purine-binding chemotaxis protein CheW